MSGALGETKKRHTRRVRSTPKASTLNTGHWQKQYMHSERSVNYQSKSIQPNHKHILLLSCAMTQEDAKRIKSRDIAPEDILPLGAVREAAMGSSLQYNLQKAWALQAAITQPACIPFIAAPE